MGIGIGKELIYIPKGGDLIPEQISGVREAVIWLHGNRADSGTVNFVFDHNRYRFRQLPISPREFWKLVETFGKHPDFVCLVNECLHRVYYRIDRIWYIFPRKMKTYKLLPETSDVYYEVTLPDDRSFDEALKKVAAWKERNGIKRRMFDL